jgi:hypothetical protein
LPTLGSGDGTVQAALLAQAEGVRIQCIFLISIYFIKKENNRKLYKNINKTQKILKKIRKKCCRESSTQSPGPRR